jgi:hypothetical protein
MMMAPTTSAQLGIRVPAINVFWLNHSLGWRQTKSRSAACTQEPHVVNSLPSLQAHIDCLVPVWPSLIRPNIEHDTVTTPIRKLAWRYILLCNGEDRIAHIKLRTGAPTDYELWH